MEPLPSHIVLDRKPALYREQGPTYCGGYSASGILESYGKPVPSHPRKLYSSLFAQLFGPPSSPHRWVEAFRQHGLCAEVRPLKHVSRDDDLRALRQPLAEGKSVMLRIGNGYLPNGRHSSLMARLAGHWVTLWGYDDGEECFYVYDSGVRKRMYDLSIPIGNVTRSYDAMLRDIECGGFPRRWAGMHVVAWAREDVKNCLS
ncbi:MAG: hypothetical protein Greene041619_136 [Candidatus Peregrinibacteria bacterium Greene0416_19]|nr:MAG: hypothetical protein Greene041619_136 [Candidatus Peregrinibacteria bacterium Greene0416_19]